MMGILELGFGSTLTRRIAFANGRASDSSSTPSDSAASQITTLMAVGRRVYWFLACIAFMVSAGAGYLYLRGLDLSSVPLVTAWAAWLILCVSQAFTVWAGVYSCFLQGTGYVGWDSILASLINFLILSSQIVAVLLGGGLIVLASVAAIGALCQRFVFLGFVRRKVPEVFQIRGRWDGAVFQSMVPHATRAWLTTLGFALVGQTDQFFIAQFKGAAEIPAYRAAFVVCVNFNIISVTFAQASSVFISQLWQTGRLAEVHRIVLRNLRLALLIMGCSAGFLLASGEKLFDQWLGAGHFIGYHILAIFCIWQFLEVQAYALLVCSRATEDEAFAFSTLGGGLLKLFLAWFLIGKFGLLGLACASLVAMLCTNYWYAVWRGLRRLQIPFGVYLRTCLLPVFGAALICYAFGSGILATTASISPIASLGLSGSAVCVAFALAVWFFVVEAHQKARITQNLRRLVLWT